jgi:hypothetical protein
LYILAKLEVNYEEHNFGLEYGLGLGMASFYLWSIYGWNLCFQFDNDDMIKRLKVGNLDNEFFRDGDKIGEFCMETDF